MQPRYHTAPTNPPKSGSNITESTTTHHRVPGVALNFVLVFCNNLGYYLLTDTYLRDPMLIQKDKRHRVCTTLAYK